MNTKLRTEAKNSFEKKMFRSMNNAVFGKTMENVRKHRDIKLIATERKTNYLVSERNYHTTKFFTENLLAIEMKKTEILMNKPDHLKLSILELSKMLKYEFWYDYVKPKYGKKAKLCYMGTDIFIVHLKRNDIYKDGIEDVETRSHTSNYELDRPLPKGKNKKVIGLIMNYVVKSLRDKRMQSIDSIKTYVYVTNKDLVSEKEVTKYNNVVKRYKK